MIVPVNLRKMFYNLVVKELIGNTKSDYGTLSQRTVDARMNGIIPIDCFVDEVGDTFDINGYNDDDEFQSGEDYIRQYLRDAPDDYVRSLPKSIGQQFYVSFG